MMPRLLKWCGIISALLLILSCFLPWVFIESKNITVTGVNTAGTNFGKPGYFHFFMTAFFLVFTLLPKIWAKRINLVVTAINIAWAVRNYFIIAACEGGECPLKKAGLYLSLFTSLVMLVSALFPSEELKK